MDLIYYYAHEPPAIPTLYVLYATFSVIVNNEHLILWFDYVLVLINANLSEESHSTFQYKTLYIITA